MAEAERIFIKNAEIIDPAQGVQFRGSLVIENGLFSEILRGKLPDSIAAQQEIIDAHGLVVSPGFIDIHAHTDGYIFNAEKELAQGVTTVACGNCGISPAKDIGAFYDEQDRKGFPVNQTAFVGHSFTLREEAGIRGTGEAASAAQIRTMQHLAAEGLSGGACGISFGIQYAPGTTTREFTEVARIAAERGKPVAVHTRLNFPNDFDSLKETLDIAKNTGATVIVSHLSYMFADGRMDRCLELIAGYQEQGYNIQADSGMYTAFSTMAGSTCYDDDQIRVNHWNYNNFLASGGRYAGRYLDRETFEYIRKYEPDTNIICFTGVEEDIYKALRYKDVVVSSDSGKALPGQGHPQDAAVFARFFRIMVRERKELSLIEGIRRCTLLPAKVLGLNDRGRMAAGAKADLVIFDPSVIRELADFPGRGNPDLPPDGISYVFVNGKCAVRNGKRDLTVRAGKAIRL